MYWPIGTPEAFEQGIPEDSFADELQAAKHEHASGRGEPLDSSTVDVEQGGQHAPVTVVLPDEGSTQGNGNILAIRVARAGHILVTITDRTLTIWQVKPTAVLTSIIRSAQSLSTHGTNVGVSLRPDAAIIVLQTSLGYLITYSLKTNANVHSYQLQFPEGYRSRFQKRSAGVSHKHGATAKGIGQDGQGTVYAATLRCRRIDLLGVDVLDVLATDHEMVISTKDPPSVQCVRWGAEEADTVEITTDLEWMHGSAPVIKMIHDRPMRLYTWIAEDGLAYAAQRSTIIPDSLHDERKVSQEMKTTDVRSSETDTKSLSRQRTRSNGDKPGFSGHCFYTPAGAEDHAVQATINSRFSLIALGLLNGNILVYHVRDYHGGVSLVQKIESSTLSSASGRLNVLEYSPDGHCLMAGYEKGWSTWSVFGHPLSSTFTCDRPQAELNGDRWLLGLQAACWIGNGSEVILLAPAAKEFWILEFARSALTTSFAFTNTTNALLQTKDAFMIYQGHGTRDLTAMTTDPSLWHRVQVPLDYLMDQWPLRAVAVSADGHYLSIAGQRGLAHYSIGSGRWKTFEDSSAQDEFVVRGGMCWHQHVLIVAVESASGYELRLYSREQALGLGKALHVVVLDSPVVHLHPSGDDSMLVYSSNNVLDHYMIEVSEKDIQLRKVGQIALHGIIRAPARVRSISWVVPEHQLTAGDPSRDVAVASIFFLVDGNLILLQPSEAEGGSLKYDMRTVAHNVEYYTLSIEDISSEIRTSDDAKVVLQKESQASMRESLWIFDGQAVKMWPDVNDVLQSAAHEDNKQLPEPVRIAIDFYPLSPLLDKGILLGMEAELTQQRDGGFSLHRPVDRTTLFLPSVLYHHLANYNAPAARHLAHQYEHLPYFSHALEVLLHNVLDDEVEKAPVAPEQAMLPAVLSLLSTFPDHYLDIIVQCTRKTELRSWRTLFAHLPPPEELFEASLQQGELKTAGGYLLVLHTLSEISSTSPQVVRLLRAARARQDWDLCKELARFLVALDESGDTLRQALDLMEMCTPAQTRRSSRAALLGQSGGASNANGLRQSDETAAGRGLGIFSTMQQRQGD